MNFAYSQANVSRSSFTHQSDRSRGAPTDAHPALIIRGEKDSFLEQDIKKQWDEKRKDIRKAAEMTQGTHMQRTSQ